MTGHGANTPESKTTLDWYRIYTQNVLISYRCSIKINHCLRFAVVNLTIFWLSINEIPQTFGHVTNTPHLYFWTPGYMNQVLQKSVHCKKSYFGKTNTKRLQMLSVQHSKVTWYPHLDIACTTFNVGSDPKQSSQKEVNIKHKIKSSFTPIHQNQVNTERSCQH